MTKMTFFQTLIVAFFCGVFVELAHVPFTIFAIILVCLLCYLSFEALGLTIPTAAVFFRTVQGVSLGILLISTTAGALLVPLYFQGLFRQSRFKGNRLLLGIGSFLPLFDVRLTASELAGYCLFAILMMLYNSVSDEEAVSRSALIEAKQHFSRQELQTKANQRQVHVIKQLQEQEIVYRERQRMLQQIHDSLGHRLTGGLFQLEAAKIVMAEEPEKAQKHVTETITILRNGISELRSLIEQEAPLQEQVSLLVLQRKVREFSQRHHLRITFLNEGDFTDVQSTQWAIIEANLEECLVNALKHGDRSLIIVEINSYQKMLQLQVTSKKQGTTEVQKGFGMRAMEERARSVEGQLLVDTTAGFRVTTLLPKKE